MSRYGYLFRGFVKAAGPDVIQRKRRKLLLFRELQYLWLPSTVTDLSPIEGMKERSGLSAANANISTLPDLTKHTKLSWS